MRARTELDPGLHRRLRAVLGKGRLLTDRAARLVYEGDALAHFTALPLAVCLPESVEEVVSIVRSCRDHEVPVTPRGAGTGLSGGAVPPAEGGVVVDVSRMRRILEVNPVDRYAVVEPGLVNQRLSDSVSAHGLFYAPDPSSQTVCTVGGNVAENAGGPHGLKHGATARHVLGLTLVDEEGEILEIGGPAGPAEVDLLAPAVGSEGTLGIVVRAVLRLTRRPAAVATLLGSFASLPEACRAVSDMVAEGLEAAAIEALDRRTIEAVEASVFAAGYPREAGAVLLVELDGHPLDVEGDAERVEAIFRRHGLLAFDRAEDAETRARLWRGRKGAFGAMGRVAPNVYVMDTVVPRSRLEEAIRGIAEICDRHGLRLANVFHAGEGNLHPNISYDARDADEVARVLEANAEIVRLCLDLGGALSGEHGVGLEKREFMGLQFSPADLESMLRLRRAWAPRGLMNPGKMLPTPRACSEVKGPRAAPPRAGSP